MTDQEACCQKQAFKDRRSNQERLLPDANNRRVPRGFVEKNRTPFRNLVKKRFMALREFVYRETSEFAVIKTMQGREMTRETFVGVIGKQEKLKRK
jgi:hypothetical protein